MEQTYECVDCDWAGTQGEAKVVRAIGFMSEDYVCQKCGGEITEKL